MSKGTQALNRSWKGIVLPIFLLIFCISASAHVTPTPAATTEGWNPWVQEDILRMTAVMSSEDSSKMIFKLTKTEGNFVEENAVYLIHGTYDLDDPAATVIETGTAKAGDPEWTYTHTFYPYSGKQLFYFRVKNVKGEAWVGPIAVTYSNVSPNAPVADQEPVSGSVAQSLAYSYQISDSDGDKVKLEIDWGDGSGVWTSDLVDSYSQVSRSHSYGAEGTFTLKATAIDEHGFRGTTHSVQVQISGKIDNPPSVTLQTPNEGTFKTGDKINIEWTSENQHHFGLYLIKGAHQVGTIYHTDSSTAQSYQWTIRSQIENHPVLGANYKIKVVVWNADGVNAWDEGNGKIKIEKGEEGEAKVQIKEPHQGHTVNGGAVEIKATITSEIGFYGIDLYINDVKIDTLGISSDNYTYQYYWNTVPIDNGSHTIRVTTTDTNGKPSEDQVTVTVNNAKVVSGRLRVASPSNPYKFWNIDNVPTGSEEYTSTVKVGGLTMIVRQDGTFDSGNVPLSDGKYTVTTELRYKDNITVQNGMTYPPTDLIQPRLARLNRTFEIRNGELYIDFHLPVFLIHGILSGWTRWNEWTESLSERGYIHFTPNHTFAGNKDDEANEIIDQFRANLTAPAYYTNLFTEAPEVNFICHSEGGVVTRRAIHQDELLAKKIKWVYTLGSPHSGTDNGWGGLWDLSVEDMLEFNGENADFRNTKVYAISGHGGLVLADCDRHHDGVVYWDESEDPDHPRENVSPFHIASLDEPFETTQEFAGYSEAHIENGHHFCLRHTSLISDGVEEILENTIIPHMERPRHRKAEINTSKPRLAKSAGRKSTFNRVLNSIITQSANSTAEYKVPVSSTDSISFIVASRKNNFNFVLIDPDGLKITQNTSSASIKYGRNEFGAQYLISNPKPGLWTMKIINGNVPDKISIEARERSEWRVFRKIDKRNYKPLSEAIFTSKLIGNTNGVTVSDMKVDLYNDNWEEKLDSIALYDDGAHHDEKAGDGIYGNSYQVPSTRGRYRVKYQTEAQYLGHTAQRQDNWGFTVLSGSRVFTGSISDKAVDSNSDGIKDKIVATVSMNLPEAGKYILAGKLEDSNGYPIESANSSFSGTAGINIVELKFDATGIGCSQFDSPFSIKELRVSTGKYARLEMLEKDIITNSYSGNDFGCNPGITPAPEIVAVFPAYGVLGETKEISLSGKGFQEGATISFGNGVSLSDINRLKSTLFTAKLTIDPDAVPGERDITVKNPDGHQSAKKGGFTVYQENQEFDLNREELVFGAVHGGGVTGSQTVYINSSDGSLTDWTASSPQDWINVSPSSGKGKGLISVSVNVSGLSPGSYSGYVTVMAINSPNLSQSITVKLEIQSTGNEPFGTFSMPADNAKVYGVVPFSGWALDDIEVARIKIYLETETGSEYIGDGQFVENACPDVEQAYPNYPMNYRCGWGYMLLSNVLPNSGNGTFKFTSVAVDKEGNESILGVRTITADNENAVKPFGTIDFPIVGGTASGKKFTNSGWILTPMPNKIPEDGSTIDVYLDGVKLGNPAYNIYRKDIADLFPGYANSNGSMVSFVLDTTPYDNGVHTIAWVAEDDAGNKDGIGSRYFIINNTGNPTSSQSTAEQEHRRLSDIVEVPVDSINPMRVAIGYDQDDGFQVFRCDKNKKFQVKIKELEKIVVELNDLSNASSSKPGNCNKYVGYQIIGEKLRPLPTGSTLDKNRGVLYWSPGPGFSGIYKFVFVLKDFQADAFKKFLNILINPKFSPKKK
jgi:hypothetical protein